MKKAILFFFIVSACISAHAQNKSKLNYYDKIQGCWQGILSAGGQKFNIIFEFEKISNDSILAKLNVKEQDVVSMPMDKAVLKDSLLTITCKAAGLKYDGVMDCDSMKIKGTWKQGASKTPFTITYSDTIKLMKHPQEPKRPFPYAEEQVSFESTAGVKLAGTLTYPNTGENFPAVVMVTGSGPQNRDEELLGHKPFLVISDYLTRHGIAVLRYDDRGTASSTGDYAKATTLDNADDALAGFNFLKTNKKINPLKIGIMGHSEGGIVAPMLAAKNKDIAFIIMLAGPGLDGAKILNLQRTLISRAEGQKEEDIKKDNDLADKIFSIIRKEKDNKKAAAKMSKIMIASLPDSLKKDMKTAMQINQQIASMTSPWMRFFITYDPQTCLQHVKCPVLALNGEKDLQVPAKENIPAIEKALKKAGNKDYTIKEMPGLNHLFQHCTTGSPTEYAKIEETFSPEVLEIIANWILKH